ncbi:MAG: hypothetical protein NUW37_02790, partial [Planctomycetes bacterium]|nr:hypothetical protein [Planctomycetota bacterium]
FDANCENIILHQIHQTRLFLKINATWTQKKKIEHIQRNLDSLRLSSARYNIAHLLDETALPRGSPNVHCILEAFGEPRYVIPFLCGIMGP